MPTARLAIAVCASVFTAFAATAVRAAEGGGNANTYTIDPVHTRVMVAVSHAGFSKALGTVSGSTGTLVFNRDDWRAARLDVTVPIARLDLGDERWTAAALASNLLDGALHPTAHFVSTTVEPAAADRARVCGELSLRGVSRPLCLDVTLNALKRHPLPPFRRTAGFSATGTLRRSDYGINAWRSVIGDEVELRIEAEAVRGGNASAPGQDAAPPSVSPATPTGSAGDQQPPASDPATDLRPANPDAADPSAEPAP